MTDPARLRIAIQKSGRLADPSLDLLRRCGIRFTRSKDQLFCQAKNFAVRLALHLGHKIIALTMSVVKIVDIGQNAGLFIVLKREHALRTLTNSKRRTLYDRRFQTLKATAIERQIGFEHGIRTIHYHPTDIGDRADGGVGLRGIHVANLLETFARALHPNSAVRVEQDVFAKRIV